MHWYDVFILNIANTSSTLSLLGKHLVTSSKHANNRKYNDNDNEFLILNLANTSTILLHSLIICYAAVHKSINFMIWCSLTTLSTAICDLENI